MAKADHTNLLNFQRVQITKNAFFRLKKMSERSFGMLDYGSYTYLVFPPNGKPCNFHNTSTIELQIVQTNDITMILHSAKSQLV